MIFKRIVIGGLALVICLSLFAIFGYSTPSVQADLSYTQADVEQLPISSDVKVVGLGEASHGVAQYHQMKADVFKSLVKNNGCRTFIIEGDFGSALKVDRYINGGDGTAEETVREIGFTIYRTQEMADLLQWMRSYNETVSPEDALHFCGMDIQSFDNNKEYLFSVLDQAAPELSAEYTKALSQLTNENNRHDLDAAALTDGKEAAAELMDKMDAAEAAIAQVSGKPAFDFARECANTIYAYCDLQLSDNYNATRDRYMYEKVDWFLRHGDGSILFINGHNGHIGKTPVAGYQCLGELLSKNLENGYYAIGTDAEKTQFNSQKDDGGFEVVEVRNSNDLNGQLVHADSDQYFIDFASVKSDESWSQIISSKQTVTTLNVGLSSMLKVLKFFYTTTFIPQSTFDGMIVFRTVTPTTLIIK
ncbi:MAG: erythromycin esterase family protein [Oscillospiraceae bacterium]|nr:erythromycin esterase family protein [Oscillospiraceae bacterium]